MMNEDEERCMGMIWPLEEIEKAMKVELEGFGEGVSLVNG